MTISTLIALLAVATGPNSACAMRCPCNVPPGTPTVAIRDARAEAQAVFLGKVVAVDTIARETFWFPNDSSANRRPMTRVTVVRYAFSVERTWKGSRDSTLLVTDYYAATSCGRGYALGENYLVYAAADRTRPSDSWLLTDSCSRVALKSHAGEDLKVLGAGRSPRR